MKHLRNVIWIFLSVFLLGTYADDHGENSVTYDKESFDIAVTEKKLFVMFFAPWCGHCKRLAPTWDELAKLYNKENSRVTIGKVDCTVERALCSENGVKGYPTVKFFPLSKEGALKYSSARTIEALTAYVQEQLSKEGEAEEMVDLDEEEDNEVKPYDLTSDTFAKHIQKGHHFVKFYAPWCGHCKKMAPTWEELATKLGNKKATVAKVDCTQHSDVCKQYGVRGYPTLLWFTDGDKVDDYRGSRTLDDLSEFVDKMVGKEPSGDKLATDGKVPEAKDEKKIADAVTSLTTQSFSDHIAKGSHFVKFFTPWCGHCQKLAPVWKQLAGEYQSNDKVTIAEVDCTKYESVCSSNDVKGYPTLIWFRNGKKVEGYTRGRSLEDLKAYTKKMLAKATEAPSGEEEEVKEAKALVDLTADTFQKHVAKGNHFVKFFAPWCGHCKRLAPIWAELAESLKTSSRVSIAKVDCTQHRKVCEKYGVQGYPTLKFFKEGDAVDEYSGARSLESLSAYVAKMLVGEEKPAEDFESVMPLGSDDFEEAIEEQFTFVAFMIPEDANWKQMEPVWTELAESLEETDEVLVASVNCQVNKDLCVKYKVATHPTLKLFHSGKEIGEYKGDKTLGGFNDFLEFQKADVTKTAHEHEEL